MPQASSEATTIITTSGHQSMASNRLQPMGRPADANQADVKLIIAGYLRESPPSELSIISQPIVIENGQRVSQAPAPESLSTGGHANGSLSAPPTGGASPPQHQVHQWQMMLIAARQSSQVRQRVSMASDQLGASLRHLYESASSIAADLPPSYHNIPGIVPYYHGRSSGPPPSYDDVVNPYAPPPSYQSLFGQMLEARKRSRGFLDLLRRLLIISTLGCTVLIALLITVPFTMIIIGAIYLDECKVEHIPAFLLVGGLVWVSKNIIHCYAQCKPELAHNSGSDGPPESSSSESSEPPVGDQAGTGAEQVAVATQLTMPTQNNQATHLSGLENHQATTGQLGQANRSRRRLKSSICESLLNCILLGWFIAGCVIVFRNYEPDFDDPNSARYCNRVVYMYTFWLITTAIMMVGLFVGCICCLMVSSAIASRSEDDLG